MVTFKPRGGVEAMAAFTDHLALCDIAVSLGDVFTLVYPRPKDGGIVRVSVGCEDVDDLVADFELGPRTSSRRPVLPVDDEIVGDVLVPPLEHVDHG